MLTYYQNVLAYYLKQSIRQDLPTSRNADAKLDGQGDEREAVGDAEVVKHVAVRRNLFEPLLEKITS